MKNEVIQISDHGDELAISFETCVLYHGRDSIGGLALGFRLIHWALAKLSPDQLPEREKIAFKTAFPGPGLRDAVEMITRAVSRGTYQILNSEHIQAPEGVYGKMYFEIHYGDHMIGVSLINGALSEDFINTGRQIKKGIQNPLLQQHWTQLKEELSNTLWSVNFEKLLVIQKQK